MTDEFKDDPTHGDATNPGLARGRVVLVAVDFSATSRHALAWAFDYALHTDATIHTLHVVDRRWSLADLSADPASVQRDVAATEAAAGAELRALTDEARARLGALHEHVVVGKPATEILRLARELAVDLIVVGSHGVDPVAQLLVGSVAERVVRGATCPVTVVRSPRG